MEEINPWTTIRSEEIYENNWIKLTEHQVLNPSGGPGIYGEIHFKSLAIGILPLDDTGNTWLVGQYRFPLKAYSWEIPAGGGAFDTAAVESAQRELVEETGFTADQWTELLRMHLSNSVSDELAIIYLARGLKAGPSEPEETEQLVIRKLPFQEAFEMVMKGEITDSLSVAAILKLQILIQNGKL
jgi:ADP-ribose pyrophosphatase